jgi:hypothetical protein
MPVALANRPELYEDLEGVWDAFVELSETRPTGFGAISYVEIESWLRLRGGVTDRAAFVYLIRALDRAWRKWQNEHGKTEPHS